MNTTLLLVVAALSYSVGGYYMKLSEGLTRGGPTALVLSPDNLQRARLMAERWDEHAPWCGSDSSAQVAQQAQLPA